LKQGNDPFAKFDKECSRGCTAGLANVIRFVIYSSSQPGPVQGQFKDKLARVCDEWEWPRYIELSAELYTYAEATERMSEHDP